MAITKLLRIKETAGGNPAAHLKNNIMYICNPIKTEGGFLIGGNAGTDPEEIYRRIIWNKKFWGKESGSQAFHYMLSLPPETPVSAEKMMQIAEEFCEELFGEEYYHVIAVHTDKEHMHAHITFDSVSMITGLKFHSPKKDWEHRIQPITDRLCKKYHLPALSYEPNQTQGISHQEWERKVKMEDGSNQNRYGWKDIIRDDIDEAISHSETYEEFLSYLEEQKYQIRDGKYLSLRPYGRERSLRSYRLGKGYGKEEIFVRLKGKKQEQKIKIQSKTYGDKIYIMKILRLQLLRTRNFSLTPYQRQFFRRWQNTYFIRKPCFTNTWKYKKDILQVHKIAEQLSYILDHDIKTKNDLKSRRKIVEKQIAQLDVFRGAENTKIYRGELFDLIKDFLQTEEMLNKFPSNSRQDLKAVLKELQGKIELIMPMEKARQVYTESQDNVKLYRKEIKNMKEELKLIDQIEESKFKEPERKESQIDGQMGKKNSLKKEKRI